MGGGGVAEAESGAGARRWRTDDCLPNTLVSARGQIVGDATSAPWHDSDADADDDDDSCHSPAKRSGRSQKNKTKRCENK